MKPFTAILFSLLLLLTPFASLPTLASNCPPAKVMTCCHTGCPMVCCQSKNSEPQPATPVPSQKSGSENQISLLALALVIGSLPASATVSFSPTDHFPLTTAHTPLYTRHCALLL